MKKIVLIFCAVSFFACGKNPYKGISAGLAETAKANITLADSANVPQLEKALVDAPAAQKDGMAFLISYMPVGDRDTLDAQFLLSNVDYAYKARENFAWAKALPDSIFYNDVLPYASLNEEREDWRSKFWDLFYPLVKDAPDVWAAVDTINKSIQDVLNVKYHGSKRRIPHQSPSESMSLGWASCSGLSIMLTDAFRAMGIPSRIAGTPLWINKSGNHNWTEVWIEGNWYVTEYNPSGLNNGWFLDMAGRADKSDPKHWMYASSWKPTGTTFLMVWDKRNTNVPAYQVSDFYINLRNSKGIEAKEGIPVTIRMFAHEGATKSSSDRVSADVSILDADGEVIAVGKTASPIDDLNNYLTIYLPEGKNLTIQYTDGNGNKVSKRINTGGPLDLELFYK